MSDTKLVGIINITPDSFSDGGRYQTPLEALAQMEKMIAQGASVIDIGAESTRPGAPTITDEEEWWRLVPIIGNLGRVDTKGVSFSIDTRHPMVAARALDAMGKRVTWLNDVSAFKDPVMMRIATECTCTLVVMHALSIPADKTLVIDETLDVIEVLLEFAKERISALEAEGVERSRIVFDPGIGFGKTAEQSLEIINRIKELMVLDIPIYVGHSRKSFIDAMPDSPDRDEATWQLSAQMARDGVAYLRVHDIEQNLKAIMSDAS